jgi:hypothetical protein
METLRLILFVCRVSYLHQATRPADVANRWSERRHTARSRQDG